MESTASQCGVCFHSVSRYINGKRRNCFIALSKGNSVTAREGLLTRQEACVLSSEGGAVFSFRTSGLNRDLSKREEDFASKKEIDFFPFSCFLTQISLDAKVRAEIDNNMNNPTEDTFKVAQDHIFTLMYHDCFPRFIKSKHYKQLLKRH